MKNELTINYLIKYFHLQFLTDISVNSITNTSVD